VDKTLLPMKTGYTILLLFFVLGLNTGNSQEVYQKKDKYYTTGGSLFSGTFKEFYQSGKIRAENSVRDGLLDSISSFYYENGARKEQRSYKAGKKDGTWITWSEAGIKTAEANFKEGLKEGYWYIFDEDGQKRYEMYYEKGEKRGKWLIWDADGKLVTQQDFK
jgi:antitoxin component YwqK of YwqJK toxin-antitoxin module